MIVWPAKLYNILQARYILFCSIDCFQFMSHSQYYRRGWCSQATFPSSLVPSPFLHVRERGSGVLNNFSCHSSPIWGLELVCWTCNYMWWHHQTRDLVSSIYMQACSAVHVHRKCNNYIIYAVRPRPMWQEMSLRTPDPLSAFWGRALETRLFSLLPRGLGTRLRLMLLNGMSLDCETDMAFILPVRFTLEKGISSRM